MRRTGHTPLRRFQRAMAKRLGRVYPGTDVETEWRAISTIKGLYSPRLDIAVGPFSVERHHTQGGTYDRLMDRSRVFFERLISFHQLNVENHRTRDPQIDKPYMIPDFRELKEFNWNARCLLAVEIENQVTRKHLLGGVVNAAALGRVGIVVGWTDDKVTALVRLQSYWEFLASVEKNTFRTRNLLILRREQLRLALS